MHEVSKAINILDPNRDIDAKICKARSNDASSSEGNLSTDKCASDSSSGFSSKMGLENFTSTTNQAHNFKTDNDKMSNVPKSTNQLVKDVSGLDREQKGKVSSAFACCY
ncbi:hypothetical protein [Anaplasma bovis]|uniref:hypothetical protein n=1 Tax=Anaplasma bovis TaxID=186733 RepID=UPI002FEF0BAB